MADGRGAERDLQRSLGLLEPLYQENPAEPAVVGDLADCYRGFGDLYASRSNWKEAQMDYQKSLDLWERWKQVGVSTVYDRHRREAVSALVARAAKLSSEKALSR